jgi:MYXO-CTERM domain-containing protein
MKTQKKSSQRLYLNTRNNRWKWMVGATAASAAGVGASEAGLVTISLSGNNISVFGPNNLNADLTGDGHPDLTIANAYYNGHPGPFAAGVSLNGVKAGVQFFESGAPLGIFSGTITLGSKRAFWFINPYFQTGPATVGTLSLTGSIPIFFKDLHINGGAPTEGFLQVTVGVTAISLDSLTYNSNTPVGGASVTVPEQGSSLALLAMGAGGILALRRRRAAQQNS